MSGGLVKGDWICGDQKCGNLNFARRDKCNKCGQQKKKGHLAQTGIEIGKDIAEKSKGLFSADDWQCKSCGNINWARRTTCNVCNSTKVNTLGERTGFGGGFMERDEVIEYKRTREESSEDEFDEFGRKKKKFRRSDKNADQVNINGGATSDGDHKNVRSNSYSTDNEEKVVTTVEKIETHIKKNNYNEEDDGEDEESGDEADLAKYDLWGGSDEEDEKDKSDKEVKSNKKDVDKVDIKKIDKSGDKKLKRSNSSSSSDSSSSSGSSDSSSSSSSSSKRSRGSEKRARRNSGSESRGSSSKRSNEIDVNNGKAKLKANSENEHKKK